MSLLFRFELEKCFGVPDVIWVILRVVPKPKLRQASMDGQQEFSSTGYSST